MNTATTGFKQEIAEWFGKHLSGNAHITTAAYGNHIAMICLEGKDICLRAAEKQTRWHAILHVHEGELRITANQDRMGFEAPVYIDFIDSYQWGDLALAGTFSASLAVVEQKFFIESAQNIRPNISEGMKSFSQSPFLCLRTDEALRMQQLEGFIFHTLEAAGHTFRHELLQTLICAWQYELWNIVFNHQNTVRMAGETRRKEAVSHFLFLAHAHCREHHEVGWYATQMGLSPDVLSATLKRFCGKTGNALLNELLVTEAQVGLRNPSLSIQDVAEMLCFSDQSAFGKFFKRQCGMTPLQYKKQNSHRY